MNTGPMSHPGNNPPDPLNPCPACGGCGYDVDAVNRAQGQPSNTVRVMACARCNPPRRYLGLGIPRTRDEIWNHPHRVGLGPALPPLHVKCPECAGWGALDVPNCSLTDWAGAETCPTCNGRGRVPTAAGQAIVEFLELMNQKEDWPDPEDHP